MFREGNCQGCEDLGVATQLFDRYYYLFKFCLKSGYHHIKIFPDHRKFHAFAWDFGNEVSRYFAVYFHINF